MGTMTRVILKLSTATTIGFSGWCLGRYSEQQRHLNAEIRDSGTNIVSNVNIKKMPGLPLFGTVSAAVPIQVDTNMGSKLSTTSTRVAEVSYSNRLTLLMRNRVKSFTRNPVR